MKLIIAILFILSIYINTGATQELWFNNNSLSLDSGRTTQYIGKTVTNTGMAIIQILN